MGVGGGGEGWEGGLPPPARCGRDLNLTALFNNNILHSVSGTNI